MTQSTSIITPPEIDEYDQYYHQYVSKFRNAKFFEGFADQVEVLQGLLGGLSPRLVDAIHEPYSWSLKQVVGHLIDCERIFSTRLLRISVGDEAPSPGINQNIYVDAFDFSQVTMDCLLAEFSHLRLANVFLAKRMSEEALARRGVASEKEVSAKANLFILAGHVEYHVEIIRKRLSQTCE